MVRQADFLPIHSNMSGLESRRAGVDARDASCWADDTRKCMHGSKRPAAEIDDGVAGADARARTRIPNAILLGTGQSDQPAQLIVACAKRVRLEASIRHSK